MDNIELLKSFVNAADTALENFRKENGIGQPKQDAFWDRLLEVLGLGPNGTKDEVINLVKELRLGYGYAKLKADKDLERENTNLRKQIAELQAQARRVKERDDEVRESVYNALKSFTNAHDRFILDVNAEISKL
jgi:FtsZ-binding cell division protein ZapB